MTHKIILLGANGSGKSTLGCELAHVLNVPHFDVEDYYFYKTNIPYTTERPWKNRNQMLLDDMRSHASYVVSGDVSGWSEEFLTAFNLAVYLSAPVDVRMKRIENREFARWGDRVLENGDMYESQMKFRGFAATRDISVLEKAVLKYSCSALYFDSTEDYCVTAARVIERLEGAN